MDDIDDPPYFLPAEANAPPPMPRAKQRHVSVGSAAQEILVVAESRNRKPDIKRLREILTDCRDDGLDVDGILRAAVDDRGYGLGHLATKCRWYEGLEILKLVDKFASDPSTKAVIAGSPSKDGILPLVFACKNLCNISIFQKLIELGADLNARDPRYTNYSVLHHAVANVNLHVGKYSTTKEMLPKCVELIEDVSVLWSVYSLDFNVRANDDSTPAHLAAKSGHLPALVVLTTATDGTCVDDNIRTIVEHSVFDVACCFRRSDVAWYLVDYYPNALPANAGGLPEGMPRRRPRRSQRTSTDKVVHRIMGCFGWTLIDEIQD